MGMKTICWILKKRHQLRRFIGGLFAGAILFVILPNCVADAPVTVTIVKRVPIQTLGSDGAVIKMTESTIGAQMTLVSMDGTSVLLQDSQGIHYRINLGATDYVPAASTSPPPQVTTGTPTIPASPPPPPAPTMTAPASPTAENSVAAATVPSVPVIPEADPLTVTLDQRKTANELAVWPPGGIPDQPLLIASHGNGGTGPKEIRNWLKIAKVHHFTIVCPSLLSPVNASHLGEDDPFFAACIHWIKDNLKYNPDGVFMTGFSGGGFPTWYLATKYPTFFRGIICQSGNFAGNYYGLDISRWHQKPIKLIWGSQDLADIPVQNGQAVDMLKSEHCRNFTTEVVEGGHHQEHPDMVVSWMEQQMATPADATN